MSRANLDQAAARTLGNRYQLISRIGSGASAEVYQATDLRLGRSVAVKQLRWDLTEDARFEKLFRTEARLAAKLSHPNIVTVFDWSADPDGEDGGAYIVTELLSGGSLRTVLDIEGTITLSQAAFIGLQAAKGLAFAHDHGLVHRDIKPANLLFGGDGRIHIGDFGIARAVAQAAWTEPEGVLIGTARYAAPEQAASGAVDGLADVYSLAVCLIEALSGEVPLVQESAIGTMMVRQTVDLPVDESFGLLAEPLALAGKAQPAARADAVELADALTAICRTLPEPDPLTLVDLTDHIGGPVAVRPNVRFDADGDLIIEGDSSNLSIPADHPSDDDGWGESHLGGVGGPERAGPAADGDHAIERIDGIDGGSQVRSRGRTGRPWIIGSVMLAALVVAALWAAWIVAQRMNPEVEVITVGLPSYPVDDFSAMNVEGVRAAVESNRWSVVVTERFADGTEPGEILSQLPAAGSMMGPGGRVELVVSLGPQRRVVPETVGRSEAEVRADIDAVNLEVGTVTERFDEEVEPGIVLEASIGGAPAVAGSESLTGTSIDLVISSGPAPREVPPIVGLTVEQARVALAEQDLVLRTTETHSETVAEGLVMAVQPAAGSQVDRGDAVTATVSLGLPFVTIPDVGGLPVPEAIELLRTEGFQVEINGTIGSEVLTTRPTAGQSVRLGSQVEIISSN